jgi:hypothetical protein
MNSERAIQTEVATESNLCFAIPRAILSAIEHVWVCAKARKRLDRWRRHA